MDNEVAALKAHIDAIVPTLATKADIEILRAEMHKMSAEGYRWMVASMVAMFIGFGGLYFAASRSQAERSQAPPAIQVQSPPPAVPAAQAQGPQPIVIYVTPPKQ
ncbi:MULTISPECIES: hypothetical protein [unclassified Duganella]|uniref:hypothetical protein n=1 Tax=unclassified Duganella TaxID=2636909 RepID=UPI0008835B44|nr:MULTISPECIES: hypothetical protein [unclassified Duganella]SDF43354.1 hypothetical protein SAMN05216320_101181 [Duganella sp. OV458]SDI83225.1 hypothetical protein SAMN05428973_1011242 [Duganella sp. OV510]